MMTTPAQQSAIKIRHGRPEDIDTIMSCYDKARRFMRSSGNLNQWINGYPSRELIARDIDSGVSFVGEDSDGEIVMAFAFIVGEDPTYRFIEDGAWPNDHHYGTIHRLGSTGKHSGILAICVDHCLRLTPELRLDTHADNHPMHRAVSRLGFQRCGIIYCNDGSPRVAYQKSRSPGVSGTPQA